MMLVTEYVKLNNKENLNSADTIGIDEKKCQVTWFRVKSQGE